MRRIFYLITELDVGGAEKTLYALATQLDRSRFTPVVGCLTGRGPLGQWLSEKGIEVHYLDMRSACHLSAWLRLRKILRDYKPDVLHTFLFHANFVGRIAARGLGIEKIIASIRVEEPRRLHLWGERITRRWVDTVTCVSESAKLFTHKHTMHPLAKLVTIANGIDVTHFDEPIPLPPEWRIPKTGPVIAVIGRLDEQKDPILMLEAARHIHAQVPKATFAFAGDGPLATICRERAEATGLGAAVRWLGRIHDVRPLLQRATCLALSSRWEGMPNVVLEAMAAGIPTVATDVGGTSELILDGVTGYLTPYGEAQALADRVSELLTNTVQTAEMGQRARIRAECSFSLSKMVRRNEALYS